MNYKNAVVADKPRDAFVQYAVAYPRKHTIPIRVTMPNFVGWSNGTSFSMETYQKTRAPRVPTLKSFKIIRTVTDQSGTCDFLLTFRSNHGPFFRFQDTTGTTQQYYILKQSSTNG